MTRVGCALRLHPRRRLSPKPEGAGQPTRHLSQADGGIRRLHHPDGAWRCAGRSRFDRRPDFRSPGIDAWRSRDYPSGASRRRSPPRPSTPWLCRPRRDAVFDRRRGVGRVESQSGVPERLISEIAASHSITSSALSPPPAPITTRLTHADIVWGQDYPLLNALVYLERRISRMSKTGQSGALVPVHRATVFASNRSSLRRSAILARILSRCCEAMSRTWRHDTLAGPPSRISARISSSEKPNSRTDE